jgi:hypothetical protein
MKIKEIQSLNRVILHQMLLIQKCPNKNVKSIAGIKRTEIIQIDLKTFFLRLLTFALPSANMNYLLHSRLQIINSQSALP